MQQLGRVSSGSAVSIQLTLLTIPTARQLCDRQTHDVAVQPLPNPCLTPARPLPNSCQAVAEPFLNRSRTVSKGLPNASNCKSEELVPCLRTSTGN
jgi:hypothetical protein